MTFPLAFSSRKAVGFRGNASERSRDLRSKSAPLEKKLEELAPQIEAAKQRMDFLYSRNIRSRLGDYLNQPANARRLFDVSRRWGRGKRARRSRAHLLQEWVHRLEERDLLFHVLASYELRKIYYDYCPPIHLQQLKKALVNREEAKRVEQILEQFPARKDFHEKAGRRFARDPPPHARGNCSPWACSSPKT